MKVALIIAAAGIGKRFSDNIKKQFYEIDKKPILYWTIKKLISLYNFDEIIIGVNNNDIEFINGILSDFNVEIKLVEGGDTRTKTVLNCVSCSCSDIVLIHDAVRPFITKKIVDNVIENAIKYDGAIPALKVRDTVKSVNDNFIKNTIDRELLYLAHTPQGFKRIEIKEAIEKSIKDNIEITDEASAMEYCNKKVVVVNSNYDNIKITFSDDIEIIEILKNKYFK